jgi:hypothetical protein
MNNNQLNEKLEELKFFETNCMEPNWDSEDAYPITHSIVILARAIILKLDSVEYDFSIHPHGTISFEQESENFRASLELGQKNYSAYLKNKQDETQNEYKAGLNQNINELLNDVEHFIVKPFTIVPKIDNTNIHTNSSLSKLRN